MRQSSIRSNYDLNSHNKLVRNLENKIKSYESGNFMSADEAQQLILAPGINLDRIGGSHGRFMHGGHGEYW